MRIWFDRVEPEGFGIMVAIVVILCSAVGIVAMLVT